MELFETRQQYLEKFHGTEYSCIMTPKEKLLLKAINNPAGLSFEDFQTLLKQSKWILDHQKGSHQIWYSPAGCRLSVQNNRGNAKAYQVKQFLHQQGREIENV
jgi:predicted RNA binding protein YcfA (HicA-like mRNA interferase family)